MISVAFVLSRFGKTGIYSLKTFFYNVLNINRIINYIRRGFYA